MKSINEKGVIIMEKLRLGIIGTGGICNHKHIPSLKKVADKVEHFVIWYVKRQKIQQKNMVWKV